MQYTYISYNKCEPIPLEDLKNHTQSTAIHNNNGNEQCGDGPYNICTCCHNKFRDCKCLKFLEHNYDFSKSVVEWALSFRFRKQDMDELIFHLCHRHLHKKCPTMLPNAIASPIRYCHICTYCYKKVSEDLATTFSPFDYSLESGAVKRALLGSNHGKSKNGTEHIYNKCCTLLKRYNYVSFVSCKTNPQKYLTFLFHENQYEFAESMVKDALGNEILVCSTN